MLKHEVRAIRLGNILAPKIDAMTPRQIRFHRSIKEKLPKAFQWSDRERMIFVTVEPGEKEPIPQIVPGEYNHVAEMIPLEHPNYTYLYEPKTERTLIFDGTRHWRWQKDCWITARRKNEVEEPVVEEILVPEEMPVLF